LILFRLMKKRSFIIINFMMLAVLPTMLFVAFPVSAIGDPPTVSTVSAINITTNSATLRGNLTDWGSLPVENDVIVYFAYSDVSGDLDIFTPFQNMSDTGPFSANISGLSPGTTYYFRAIAIGDDTGTGIELSFTTQPSLPPPPQEMYWIIPEVITVAATNITHDSATLNGMLKNPGTAPSVFVYFGYGLRGTYASYTFTPLEEMAGAGPFSFDISGLAPGTTYHFMAFARGDGRNYGFDLSFETLQPPDVITGTVSSITIGEATLNGNLADLGTADNVSVFFEYGLTAGYGDSTPAQVVGATGAFAYDISNLDAGSVYHFRAVAEGDGFGYGDDMVFSTLDLLEVDIEGKKVAAGTITIDGLVTTDISAVAQDRSITIHIAKNTIALDRDGTHLKTIAVETVANPPRDLPTVGPIYRFGPTGASFNPPIELSISYTQQQLPLLHRLFRAREHSLSIAYFNGTRWVKIRGWVDVFENRVTTIYLSHFSEFAIVTEDK